MNDVFVKCNPRPLHQLLQVHREGPGLCLCEKSVLQGGLLWKLETHPLQSAIPQVPMKGCSWAEKRKVSNHATGREGS